jgi:hypothetical protein
VIAIRVGLLGRLLRVVPVGEVAEILPQEERIVLRLSPRPTATERARDLRGQAQPSNSKARDGAAGAKRLEAQREVKALFKRLTRVIGLRFGRGGEREMTPDVEASAEPSAEEPPAEQTEEEPETEETPTEEVAEAAPAQEAAAEQPPVEEQATEEQPTA